MRAVTHTVVLAALRTNQPATAGAVAQRAKVDVPTMALWIGTAIYDGYVEQLPRRPGGLRIARYRLTDTGQRKAKELFS